MTTVIATVAQKGGVGKTTTAVALALDAANRGLKTMFIDYDSQGNGTDSFHPLDDLDSYTNSYSFLTAESVNPVPIKENLFLLPASLDLILLDNKDFDYNFKLRNQIQSLLSEYDLVVIDTPGTTRSSVVSALVAANYIYSPLELTSYSVAAFSEVQTAITSVRRNTNPSLSFMGFVLNRVHGFRVVDGVVQPHQVTERKVYNEHFPEGKGTLSIISERADIRQAIQQGKELNQTTDGKAAIELSRFCEVVLKKAGLIND
jgi:cellulose biosynthesis protein BcsQ